MYDVSGPIPAQPDSRSSTVAAVAHLLAALGVTEPPDGLATELLRAGVVSWDRGNVDPSGQALATFLARVAGRPVDVLAPSWDEITTLAGNGPLLVGSASVGEWSVVVGRDGDGNLELRSGSAGWRSFGSTLTLTVWDESGPWTAIALQPVERTVGARRRDVPALEPEG